MIVAVASPRCDRFRATETPSIPGIRISSRAASEAVSDHPQALTPSASPVRSKKFRNTALVKDGHPRQTVLTAIAIVPFIILVMIFVRLTFLSRLPARPPEQGQATEDTPILFKIIWKSEADLLLDGPQRQVCPRSPCRAASPSARRRRPELTSAGERLVLFFFTDFQLEVGKGPRTRQP